MDSSDPRMQLLQKWNDEGLLAKAGFVGSKATGLSSKEQFLSALQPDAKKSFNLEEKDHFSKKKKGKKGKEAGLTEREKQLVNSLSEEKLRQLFHAGSKLSGSKKGNSNPYLSKEWGTSEKMKELETMLLTKKNELNNLVDQAMGYLSDGTSIDYPAEIMASVGSAVVALKSQDAKVGIQALSNLATALMAAGNLDEKKFRYHAPKNVEAIAALDASTVKSILISKLLYIVIKFLQLHYTADERKKYDFEDLKHIEKGLGNKKAWIRQIETAIARHNKLNAKKTKGDASENEPEASAGGSAAPAASMANFGTGVFNMGRPFR